jgi:hypothetical protein
MTPKEKAVIIIDRYLDEVINQTDINNPLELPKRLALIAVDEILKITWVDKFLIVEDYWNEVKQEIEKL